MSSVAGGRWGAGIAETARMATYITIMHMHIHAPHRRNSGRDGGSAARAHFTHPENPVAMPAEPFCLDRMRGFVVRNPEAVAGGDLECARGE